MYKHKKMTQVVGIFFLFLLCMVSVSALQENFNAIATTNTPSACSYAVTTNSIIVTNIGDVESTYAISAFGSASQFTTYSDGTFSLKPSETKTIFVYIAPGSIKGSFNLETNITTVFGLSKIVSQTIGVQNCANININVETPQLEVEPCQPAQFIFDVTNTGSFGETYNFGAKGLEQFTTLSTQSAFLNPGETKQIDVFVNPTCDVYGQQSFTFQALAQTTKYLAEVPVSLDINRNYDFTVSIPATETICNYNQSSIPIQITNNVPFTNQYDISVNAPSWMKQEAYRVQLGPLSSGTTLLVAQPQNPGTYEIGVTLDSIRGDIVKSGNEEIVVDKCYANQVSADKQSDLVVQGNLETFSIALKNTGTNSDTYNVSLQGQSWITSDTQQVQLGSGETKIITISGTPNETTSGDFNTILTIQSAQTQQTHTYTFKTKVISAQTAYDLAITDSHTRVLIGTDQVTVNLQNNGILPATYNLKLNGPQWATIPASTVTLQPGEKVVVPISTATANSTELGDYQTEFIATVANQTIGFDKTFNIQLRSQTVTQEAVQFIIVYSLYVAIVFVLLLLLLLWLIFGKRISRRYRTWKVKRQATAKFNKELKEALKAKKEEEKKAKQLLKESIKAQKAEKKATARRERSFWKGFGAVLFILVVLIILAGTFLAIAGYTPYLSEFFNQVQQNQGQQLFAPMIQVNGTGLESYGNTVIVRGTQVTIPVMVKNNYNNDILFDVETDNSTWIHTDTKQIDLAAGEQATINLQVTPNENVHGVYKISISAILQQENKQFNEAITINVRKKNILLDALDYIWYGVAGVVALILIVLLMRKRSKKSSRGSAKEQKKEVTKFKPLRRVSIDIPMKK